MVTNIVDKNADNANLKNIPRSLIYEELAGIPVYYRGYKEVLNKSKTLEEIMGYGDLQVYLLNILSDFLKLKLSKEFLVLVGGTGLHLKHKENLSLDLCIYPRKDFSFKNLKNKYLAHPPKVVIEVDTKADKDINKHFNYFAKKTQTLLDFGIEQVIWIFTEPEKVMVASKDSPWITVNWKDTIQILNIDLTIQTVIEEAENILE